MWRMTPVEAAEGGAGGDLDRSIIFPSARQALDAVVAHIGLGRRDYVGIPDYAGHCVIDFLARRATPVPLRFLPQAATGAMLLYDQWGWQRPASSLAAVRARRPGAAVIWDRVDALPSDFDLAARAAADDRLVQLFSLSKTLGAGGGGLIWSGRDGWVPSAAGDDCGFVNGLHEWARRSGLGVGDHDRVDRFFRNECPVWPPALRRWLSAHSVNGAAAGEAEARRARLDRLLRALDLALPLWMQDVARDARYPAPGLLPVRLGRADGTLLSRIEHGTNLRLFFYHFDYSSLYDEPDWTLVLPVPLHSDVSFDQIDRLAALLRRLDAFA